MTDKKVKYLTKTVAFGSESLTLFSIDGQTWSTRKEELLELKDRLENDRVTLVKKPGFGGQRRPAAPIKPSSAEDDSTVPESAPAVTAPAQKAKSTPQAVKTKKVVAPKAKPKEKKPSPKASIKGKKSSSKKKTGVKKQKASPAVKKKKTSSAKKKTSPKKKK